MLIIFISCGEKKKNVEAIPETHDASKYIVGDSMIYGLACDGTSDSFVVVLPFNGDDPVTYSCIDAHKANKIIGKPQIGDWVGLMLDPEDSLSAEFVINLDQLKGTWTYPVMPTLKDFKHLSRRMQRKMEKQMISEMSDSMKATILVPREYGFSLKRGHAAQPVGRIFKGSSLEDDSPVEYPEVKNYRQWFMWNTRLILVSGSMNMIKNEKSKAEKDVFDTLDFVSLSDDSLVLIHHGQRIGFHRKSSAREANAEATKKAQDADKKAAENLK